MAESLHSLHIDIQEVNLNLHKIANLLNLMTSVQIENTDMTALRKSDWYKVLNQIGENRNYESPE